MSYAVGEVWESVQGAIKQWDDDTLGRIKKECQKNYYNICRMTDWAELRRIKSLTFDASETDGLWLPADLIGIKGVASTAASQERVYKATQQGARYHLSYDFFYYLAEIAPSPLDTIKGGGSQAGLTINQDSATIAVTLGGDRTGEYCILGKEPGYYLLTAEKTISPIYRGDALRNQSIVVRPKRQKKVVIIDNAGDLMADTVQVHYWAYPEPLFQDWQEIMLPSIRPLELMTIISMLTKHDDKQSSAKEYKEELSPATGGGAMSDMLEMNPKYIAPAVPRGKTGRISFMGRRRAT